MSSEQFRLQTLHETKLLDSDRHDADFDRYTRLAARIFKTPIALITLIDGQRAWIKSALGFSAPAVPRDLAICAHLIRDSAQPILTVENTLQDCRFCGLPAVTASNGLRFYSGAVILCQGRKLGTLCVLDHVAHDDVDETKQSLLLELAQLVSFLVEKRRERAVEQEEEVTRIIVGGIHHLKSPLREVNALFSSKCSAKRLSFQSGAKVVDALQQSALIGQQLAGQVDWECCKVLQFGEVAVDVLQLSTVFSSIATLAANDCEKMQVLMGVETPLAKEALSATESTDEIQSRHR